MLECEACQTIEVVNEVFGDYVQTPHQRSAIGHFLRVEEVDENGRASDWVTADVSRAPCVVNTNFEQTVTAKKTFQGDGRNNAVRINGSKYGVAFGADGASGAQIRHYENSSDEDVDELYYTLNLPAKDGTLATTGDVQALIPAVPSTLIQNGIAVTAELRDALDNLRKVKIADYMGLPLQAQVLSHIHESPGHHFYTLNYYDWQNGPTHAYIAIYNSEPPEGYEEDTIYITVRSDAERFDECIKAPAYAQVGQVLAVKSVDSQDRPVEWKVVNTGGEPAVPSEIIRNGTVVTGEIRAALNNLRVIKIYDSMGCIVHARVLSFNRESPGHNMYMVYYYDWRNGPMHSIIAVYDDDPPSGKNTNATYFINA